MMEADRMPSERKPRRFGAVLAAGAIGVALIGAFGVAQASANSAADSDKLGFRTPGDFINKPAPLSPEQTELLEGGVTEDEYMLAFSSYRDCLALGGFELVGVDTTRIVVEYSIPDSAVQEGVHQQCYASEFGAVDREWQLANERTAN